MSDYHDHYLKKDVLLLADVFEKFSSPGLSWDAMLKKTGVKLRKTSDIDMYLLIEKGLRGGIYCNAKRYSNANNKYMENYDPSKSLIYIQCLDMNNL